MKGVHVLLDIAMQGE